MPKRTVAVLTDSACDMPEELALQSGVDILSFEITVDGVSYTERVDFDFDDYYEMLRTCEKVPSTAHITKPRFLAQFKKYFDDGIKQVLYVSINASGSATNDAACMARDSFYASHPKCPMQIHIVDSHSYSMVYGYYIAKAAQKLANGAEMSDIIEWLEDMFARLDITLAAFSLKFMKKSGRISAAAAFAGELLGLRPIISLTDGISTVRKKVRGDRDVLPSMMEHTRALMDDCMEYMVIGTNDDIINELAELCRKQWKAAPLGTYKLGAAVSTNTGPDAIAIIFVGEKRCR